MLRVYKEFYDFVGEYTHREWIEEYELTDVISMDGKERSRFNARLKENLLEHDLCGLGYLAGENSYFYGTMNKKKIKEMDKKIKELKGWTIL